MIDDALNDLVNPKKNQLKGTIGMSRTVINVSGRSGFIWIRLLDNPNELVKAHNSKVAASFGMPVIIEWDGYKYEVIDRDVDRYPLWGSPSSFLPEHGAQHSAMRDAEGADIVWVDSRQFLPMLVLPNGVTGSRSVAVSSYPYKNSNNDWGMIGGTGSFDFPGESVTGSNIYLLMVNDSTFELYAITGSVFPKNITGTGEILQYAPKIPLFSKDLPLAMIRTSIDEPILWNNLYDARQFFSNAPSMVFTGTSAISSLYGDVVANGDGAVQATIQPKAVENSMLADMTGPTIKGRASGTGSPEDLDLSQLIVLGAFSGDAEDISSQITGTGITHFTFTTPAYLIWVMADGVKQKDADVTFVTNTNSFDLSWSPSTGTCLEVIRLAPTIIPPDDDIILLQHQLPNDTEGGASVANTWTTLPVNTEVIDVGNHCTLSANQFTLDAGTYEVDIESQFFATNSTTIRLRNITDNTTELLGIPSTGANSGIPVRIVGKFTIATPKTFALQYICQTAVSTYGLGVSLGVRASNYTDIEIYRSLYFKKVA